MKKLLRKRSMLLVALLVELCMPVAAQTNGTIYYIQNEATRLFLTVGGEWGFFAVEGGAAHPVVLSSNGDFRAIGTVSGYLGSNELWMDRPASESKWTFESTGTNGQYYIKNENGVCLASQTNKYGQLSFRTKDEADSRQKWNLYTLDQIKNLSASVDSPVDLTALIRASSFDIADGAYINGEDANRTSPFAKISPYSATPDSKNPRFNGFWTNYDTWHWHTAVRGEWGQPEVYNGIGIIKNTDKEVTITQNIGKLKKGSYYFSFQGFYRYMGIRTIAQTWEDRDMDVTVSLVYGNSNTVIWECKLKQDDEILVEREWDDESFKYVMVDKYEDGAALLRDFTSYVEGADFYLDQDRDNVKIIIHKEKTDVSKLEWILPPFAYKELTMYNWTCFDNFALVYYGSSNATSGNGVDFTDLYKSNLERFIEEIEERVAGFSDEAKALFDISEVKSNIGNIENQAEYLEALETISREFQEAYNKHHSQDGVDVSELIKNPDFEERESNKDNTAKYWVGGAIRTGKSGMTNVNNSYYGKGTATAPITQTISVPTAGLYKVTARVGGEAGCYVYLMANHYHKGVQITDANKLQEVELEFMVTADDINNTGSASVIVGVVAGSATIDDPNNYKYYGYGNTDAGYGIEAPTYGKAVKADHFRLLRVCNEANGYLKLALNEANNAIEKLTPEAQSAARDALRQYEDMYSSRSATGTGNGGKGPSANVFRSLQNVVKTQNTEGADFTYAILNNSFEMQYYPNWEEGWSFLYAKEGWGNPAVNQGNDWAYVTDDAGRSHYLMAWRGTPLAQHIVGIPNGDYELKVLISSSNPTSSGTVYLTAQKYNEDGTLEAPYKSNSEWFEKGTFEYFKDVTLDFSVTDNNVVVAVRGGDDDDNENPETPGKYTDNGHWWYKADNFRLKFCGHRITLDESSASLAAKKRDWYTTVTLNRTFKKPQESTGKATWNSFVVPFDIPASALVDWQVKELISSEISDDGTHISLTFDDPIDGIKAGVPYMVRNHNLTEDLKTLEFKNIHVDPTLHNKATDHVVFTGVYEKGYIPEGAYYISNNKFYLANGDKNTIKGYRAYIMPIQTDATANVRSMSFRIEGEGETYIENVIDVDDRAAVVGIYDVNGTRLSKVKFGINILRMNNGTTQKVIVK